MTLQVREAGASDAPLLADVAAATFPLACPPGTAPESIAAFIADHLSVSRFDAYLADDERMLLLVEEVIRPGESLALGYAMLVFTDPTDAEVAAAVANRPTVELSKFYVLPDRHGGGVAAPLMAAVLAAATRGPAESVWLGVNQQNGRARRFYEKSGFRVVGTKHFMVGPERHDDFVLERLVEP
ncbi:GNAT family N-acetyltransferase [Naasia lichenicola]|uniref:GNAT family N-acetyltransferase n=1 Tax=Naasia lichenicola TaxID=2565933 RepID=A0A4S4FLA3_9MICO|nr:GNAT family N-acetyltransferase [Naasia lichenicola]THG30968.1 GNAT family N-acetyltransferase [Naasia lichenicola]